jgi:chromosome segregation ATPase
MVWPFSRAKEDFNTTWMTENRILSEYRSVFNKSKRWVKRELKRIKLEIGTKEREVSDFDDRISNIEQQKNRLSRKQAELEKRDDAKYSTELDRVIEDIAVLNTELNTLDDQRQNAKMRSVDLRSTERLLEGVINGTYTDVQNARNKFIPYTENLAERRRGNLAPMDQREYVDNTPNMVHQPSESSNGKEDSENELDDNDGLLV